jgi:hypothetical protein
MEAASTNNRTTTATTRSRRWRRSSCPRFSRNWDAVPLCEADAHLGRVGIWMEDVMRVIPGRKDLYIVCILDNGACSFAEIFAHCCGSERVVSTWLTLYLHDELDKWLTVRITCPKCRCSLRSMVARVGCVGVEHVVRSLGFRTCMMD